jgi:hypothetical protein
MARQQAALVDTDTHQHERKLMNVPPIESYEAMSPEQHEAQRRSWVVGELTIQHPDMSRDEATAIYETANTGKTMEEIKAAAILRVRS